MRYVYLLSPVLATALTVYLSGCGVTGSTKAAIGSVALSDIPNASTMAAENSAAAGERQRMRDIGLESEGTPPTFMSIASSPALIDSDVFGGMVSTIDAAQSAAAGNDAAQFFGQVDGGPGGMPACQILQGVAQSMGNVISNSNTTCFLQNIAATDTTGIVVNGVSSQAAMFNQGASDSTIKMQVSNMGGGQGVNMDVDLTIAGTSSVGSDVYKVTLDFCQPGTDLPTGEEIITVNKSTGAFSDNVTGSSGGGGGGGTQLSASTLSAYLTGSGSSLAYDLTKDRIATYYQSQTQGGQSNINQGQIKFHGNNTMETWQNSSFSCASGCGSPFSGTNQTYGDAIIGGSDLSTLLISDAAVNSIMGNTFMSQQFVNNLSANTAWVNTEYTAGSASSVVTSVVSAETIASDSFFSQSAPSTTVTSGFSCNGFSPTITGTMDGNDPNVAAIQTACNNNNLNQSLWQMCQSTSGSYAVQTAQNYATGAFNQPSPH
jgi:hypothetical protein